MKTNIRKYNKGAAERKVEIKIDEWDTYSLDHTLSLIILPALLQLKATKHGVPNEFVNDKILDVPSQRYFSFAEDDRDAIFEAGIQEWNTILDKMIWAFQQIVTEDYDSKYHHGKMKIGWKPIQYTNPATGIIEEMHEMVDENPDEHWYDVVGHMLHEERIQEGLDLFGKYFRNLWD